MEALRAVPILLGLLAVGAAALYRTPGTAQPAVTAAPTSQTPPTPTPTGADIALRAQPADVRRSEDRPIQLLVAGLGVIPVVNIVGL